MLAQGLIPQGPTEPFSTLECWETSARLPCKERDMVNWPSSLWAVAHTAMAGNGVEGSGWADGH